MAKESLFLNHYKEEMLYNLKRVNPNLTDEQILTYLNKKIEENEKLNTKEKNVGVYNNYTQTLLKSTLLGIFDFYLKKSPIMTGYGAMFHTHEEAENINAKFIRYLMSERKAYKKVQFEGLNEGDKDKESLGERSQKTFKLLNNAYYGITSEPNSQFYNDVICASITYTGYQVITTSILAFEMLLSNNVKYDNLNELLIFLGRITKDYNTQNENILEVIDKDKVKTTQEVYDYLKSEVITCKLDKDEKDILKSFLKKCSKEEINRIYYTNNLYKFLDNKKPSKLIHKLIDADVLDPNKISDELKKTVDEIWDLIRKFVTYNYNILNRAERCLTMTRKSILTIDTDSNFIYLDPYFKYCQEKYKDIDYSQDIKWFSTINSAVLFLSRFIQMALDKFTSSANVPVNEQPTINMKNEFLYSRILLTRNKKQYTALLFLQEGNIINPPKVDMKGMSIKKANVCMRTRKYFTSLINEYILKSKTISRSSILKKFLDFETEIEDSLKQGDTDFLLPAKANEPSSYKNPERMPVMRGVLIWDKLFPDNNIQTPAKVNMIKIDCEDIEKLEVIKDKFPNEYNIIAENIFGNELYRKYGFTAISMPKSVTKIPEFLLPLLNYNEIINDNTRVGYLILESLGFKLVTYNNQEYYTTIVKM